MPPPSFFPHIQTAWWRFQIIRRAILLDHVCRIKRMYLIYNQSTRGLLYLPLTYGNSFFVSSTLLLIVLTKTSFLPLTRQLSLLFFLVCARICLFPLPNDMCSKAKSSPLTCNTKHKPGNYDAN